jgi:putative ABC transport system substrate-binding protein
VLVARMTRRPHRVNAQLRHAPDGRFALAGDAGVRHTSERIKGHGNSVGRCPSMSRDGRQTRLAVKAGAPSATRRRILHLGTVGLALLASPRFADSQQRPSILRIVELNPSAGPQEQQRVFRHALRELGYIQGENILIEDRFASGSEERLREYATEAVRLKADVIIAISSSAIRVSANATKTISIVGLDLESDPVASGFVASLARPGGNLTGVFVDLPELFGKGLQLLKEAVPGIARVAVLRDPTLDPAPLRAAEGAAHALGLQLQVVEARGPSTFESAFRAAVKGRNDALIVIPSPRFGFHRRLIGDLAIKYRLPTASVFPHFTEAGLLMSYGPNVYGLYRQAATYVDKILKGAKPGDLPVQRPVRFEMLVNLKTAKALGLTIPQSLLLRADHVIE